METRTYRLHDGQVMITTDDILFDVMDIGVEEDPDGLYLTFSCMLEDFDLPVIEGDYVLDGAILYTSAFVPQDLIMDECVVRPDLIEAERHTLRNVTAGGRKVTGEELEMVAETYWMIFHDWVEDYDTQIRIRVSRR